MKKNKITCIAFVVLMILSMLAVASAETPSIYIPSRLSKFVKETIDDYKFPTLVTRGDSDGWNLFNDGGYMYFRFSERPDWFGAVVSSKNGGWIDIPVNSNKYAELELEDLVLQPGGWSWNGVARVDGPKLDNNGNPERDQWGNIVPDLDKAVIIAEGRSLNKKEKERDDNWYYEDKDDQLNRYPFYIQRHITGENSPYIAGKNYGDYSVTVNYHRDGSAFKVAVALKNIDLFETGMDGATSTITFELVNVELDSYEMLYKIFEIEIGGVKRKVRAKTKPNNNWVKTFWDDEGNIDYIFYQNLTYNLYDLANTEMWYVSSVSTTYPEGNYIVGVEAKYKNDEKNNLSQYSISYAVNETDIAKIFYNTSDDAFYGQYSNDGTITAVSGSGNNLNKWYKYNGSSENVTVQKPIKDKDGNVIKYVSIEEKKLNNNSKQMKNIKKGIKSYPTPRVKTK